MINRIFLLSFLITFSHISYANQVLPFTGTRYFDFYSAHDTGQTIQIKPNGYTIITSGSTITSGSLEPFVIFKGQYSSMLSINNGKLFYIIIGNNAIAQLDQDKNLHYGCSNYDYNPCVVKLTKD